VDYKRLKEFSHSLAIDEVITLGASTPTGITQQEARERLLSYGQNIVPDKEGSSLAVLFIGQFKSPFIYILLIAAILSLYLGHIADSIFIFGILVLNAIIGTIQEFSAQKSAEALKNLTQQRITTFRDNAPTLVDSANIVPGDVILIDSGVKLPADGRLIQSNSLRIDESLLTGESVNVDKSSEKICEKDALVAERKNMVFAGTMVSKGRATVLVTATGLNSELGSIAKYVLQENEIKTPLLLRMEKFTIRLAFLLGILICSIGAVLAMRGDPLSEVLLLAVAMGVGAIPEGLPVAMTVALSLAARRMAKRNVIVRQLSSVEALGSCTYIGTDKTGTLTKNKLSAENWVTKDGQHIVVGTQTEDKNILNLYIVAGLANEAIKTSEGIKGDTVDVALMHAIDDNQGLNDLFSKAKEIAKIPYESHAGYSASLHSLNGKYYICVKGAPEKFTSLKSNHILQKNLKSMTSSGNKVIALALSVSNEHVDLNVENVLDVEVVGLVGLIDPPRGDAKEAVKKAKIAGIKIAMITGDHPRTSFAIASKLEIAESFNQVCTGPELKTLGPSEFDEVVGHHTVFARVEPGQKYLIAKSLISQGHFLAITGDGANDAPALKVAHVGVAMGKSGTDLAKETSQLIITDDKFSSIIAGIEEGRVAYSNIRKVIYLLMSTGAAEIILFTLCVFFKTPMPLTAVQILWLNLVTNGIQDVALAFEPKEGDELTVPPRRPKERIFNCLMIKRVALSSVVVATVAFLLFINLLKSGMSLIDAQNNILLLLVLFENIMVGNARSERSSGLKNILRNPLLIYGTILAQAVHILAMHWRPMGDFLQVSPVDFETWFKYLFLASSVFIVIELQKMIEKKRKLN
tara:strand:- start:270393 stop:272978 length:2586 start_codon:yes stop_codon:yes gene_type:complete